MSYQPPVDPVDEMAAATRRAFDSLCEGIDYLGSIERYAAYQRLLAALTREAVQNLERIRELQDRAQERLS